MPVAKLTAKSVDKLKAPDPSGKQVLHWDSELKGFAVLCSGTTNAKTYVAQRVLPGGKTRRVTVGAVAEITVDEARERAADTLDSLRRGVDPKAKVVNPTLRQAFDEYLTARKDLSPATVRVYRVCVDTYLKPWADLPMRSITPTMVEERHRAVASEVSGGKNKGESAANLSIRVFRLLYNFLADRVPDLPPIPMRLMKRQWFNEPRRTGMVPAEKMPEFYRAVCSLDNAVARDFILLVLFTGMRLGEASSLTWADVDLTLRVIRVTASRTKAKRKLDLPMSDFVRDLLVARRSLGDAKFVFPGWGESGHLSKATKQLALVAESTGVRVSHHDLRRTFLTAAESADISVMSMKLLVNHSLGRDVTGGYVVMSTERLRQAAQRVADKIKELCEVLHADAPNVARIA